MTAERSGAFCVCVAGVGGTGKTALLTANVCDHAPRDRHVAGSSIVRALIAPSKVEDLDRWPEPERAAIRAAAIRQLQAERGAAPGRLLIDGHFTLRNRSTGVIEPVFTPEDRAFYDALVLLDPPAESIAAWRLMDERRRRRETVEQIEEHLAAERAEFVRLARSMRVPSLAIETTSSEGRLGELTRFLDNLAPCGGRR